MPNFSIGTWSPSDAGSFLEDHEFTERRMRGDDIFWKGKRPDGKVVIVWYPTERKQLADRTMGDSVMHKSGYPKKHWDLWRDLGRKERRSRECCNIANLKS